MRKNKIQNSVIIAGLLVLQSTLFYGSVAIAKKKAPMKAYSFIVEGGKSSQGECDGERKVPGKLKRLKEYAKASSYMGSELQAPDIKGKAGEEMWKHFFKVKTSCNGVLAKTPSSIESGQRSSKTELPPEDSGDSEGATRAETPEE